MNLLAREFQQSPYAGHEALPSAIVFWAAQTPADAAYPVHSHPWGEFVYSFSGMMEVVVAGRQYLVPSQYGLWLPPNVEHQGLNRHATCHGSLYISAPHCTAMPEHTCALTISPLVRSMLEHLHQSLPPLPYRAGDERLLQVLVDQLEQAEGVGSYLPTSQDPQLSRLLRMLDANPGDGRTVAQLASAVHLTERTLVRRCQRDLSMSLNEWRQRLRIVKAMPLLIAGRKVESIALELGYGSSSAFIAMFRRLMGVTPDEYRKTTIGK
ncbi:AraC family transcriptional regulator [Gynuella sunshinyii]|uniref:AraC-type DNA-binding domain-containing protein n=1 Tax=Gynuella sunshinyii YC6258 TaxID=1445510 RepID=A0A0C5VNC8_9GAMM|nr:helix-turn-helix transcriptional regulator [Gynuella sunshinyii]AJQ94883.1 araC-type DNA-binding domain-containing protein [Gynuella sunshinyii YC6258]